jgi:hypothetical protein
MGGTDWATVTVPQAMIICSMILVLGAWGTIILTRMP